MTLKCGSLPHVICDKYIFVNRISAFTIIFSFLS